jgi:L,D-transpeptidase YcbB
MHSRQFLLVDLLTLALFLLVPLAPLGSTVAAHDNDMSPAIEECLEIATRIQMLPISKEPLGSADDLAAVYEARAYAPIWLLDAGPSPAAEELMAAIGASPRHGLSSSDYHYAFIARRFKSPSVKLAGRMGEKELAELEVVLSDAFVNLANHLANGKVDPVSICPHWVVQREDQAIFGFLAGIRTAQDVRAALKALAPESVPYRSAMIEADRLREVIATGGWPVIPPGKTLRKGDRSPRIIQIRQRLCLDGYLRKTDVTDETETLFDSDLEEAVFMFQSRHGLVTDAAVGRRTLAALNRSPEDLLETVLVNLERWRWLPRDLGPQHILVNAAAFSLGAFEHGQQVLEMRIIVGEAITQTPTFSQDMAYLVFNPYWNVPHGILERKILPKIRKDPTYIAKNHFEVIKGWKEPPVLVAPATVDWSRVRADNFPGRLRQRPGPWNSLGRIKFIFPNRFSVYLHDTPGRHLFQRTVRTFSSGCIRVERPVELAVFVLGDGSGWDEDRIHRILKTGKTTAVPVQGDVTVHLVYWTFWVDEGGDPQYRADVYDRDRVLWKALNAVPSDRFTWPTRPLPEMDPNMGVDTKE